VAPPSYILYRMHFVNVYTGWTTGGIDIPYQFPYHWVQRTQAHIVVTIK